MDQDLNRLILNGVTTHNLKNIDVFFEPHKITCVTGISGSGKSSLVFSTLHSQGLNSYLETFDPATKNKIQAMPWPKIKSCKNLPPSIALRQHIPFFDSRSTVGSFSEINSILRQIFTKYSKRNCPICKNSLESFSSKKASEKLIQEYSGQKAIIIANIQRSSNQPLKNILEELQRNGFTRIFENQKTIPFEDIRDPHKSQIPIAIDKIQISRSKDYRIEEAIALAYEIGFKKVEIFLQEPKKSLHFSKELFCTLCNKSYPKLNNFHFQKNHPEGACKNCEGSGFLKNLIKTNYTGFTNKSLEQVLIALEIPHQWVQSFLKDLKKLPNSINSIHKKVINGLDSSTINILLYGNDTFIGLENFLHQKFIEQDQMDYDVLEKQLFEHTNCVHCEGSGLNPNALHSFVFNHSFHQLQNLSLENLYNLKISSKDDLKESHDIYQEFCSRLKTLLELNLEYLILGENSKNLSGGEVQRIQLAKVISSKIFDALICLDEPSASLHPKDLDRIFQLIKKLPSRGNTVVIVDHNSRIINQSDDIITLGPFAGKQGGFLVDKMPIPPVSLENRQFNKASSSAKFIKLTKIQHRYFQKEAVKFPLGEISVICGVSGSGKSTLLREVLVPHLQYMKATNRNKNINKICSFEVNFPEFITQSKNYYFMDQKSLGRSPRSNILTYLNLSNKIRNKFASLPESKRRGYTATFFNKSSKKGQCSNCTGTGSSSSGVNQFTSADNQPCETCDGTGFKKNILNIKYLGLSLVDILQLTITDGKEFFKQDSELVRVFGEIEKIGLGYITLGQPTSCYSGGEAQRLKLLKVLLEAKSLDSGVFLFDEPSVGLSSYDIFGLLKQFRDMCNKGATVIIVEHNIEVLTASDWIIEVGPGPGPLGGKIIFEGPSPSIKNSSNSIIANYIDEPKTVEP